MHTEYRSVLGQINWLQSRSQFHICYQFSVCASASSAPTIANCKELNKLVRTIRAQPVTLRFWPLKGPHRFLGLPDASYKNNQDKSSQRGEVIFLAEARRKGERHGKGSLIDFESKKIKQSTPSTTVAELYSFIKCYGTCKFLQGLWCDISGEKAPIHMRTDANNLVTTARTTHQPEQKETIHMIQVLRKESNSGDIEDLSHIVTEHCLSDCLTKSSAKSDNLRKAIQTGRLTDIDVHPAFRSLTSHKAYWAQWLVHNIPNAYEVVTFMDEPMTCAITQYYMACRELSMP